MTINEFDTFMSRKGFKKNLSSGAYEKTIRDMIKRYVFNGNNVFLESKTSLQKTFNMVSYADLREVYINDSDQLSGFKRFIPAT